MVLSGHVGNVFLNANGQHEQRATKVSTFALLQETAVQVQEAKLKGYEGDPCLDCGQFTLVRNGSCLKCISCGTTSGCS